MASTSEIERINQRGHANGWHAQQLAAAAEKQGCTMADLFARAIENATAFNVPARCVRVTSAWVFYLFSDGSKLRITNQNHGH